MARFEMLWFLIAVLCSLLFAWICVRAEKRRLAVIFEILAAYFMAMIVGTWGMGMLQTAGKIDAVRMYLGVSAEGMPYVEGPKDVQTPIFFAFARFALSLTDGSLASYIKSSS